MTYTKLKNGFICTMSTGPYRYKFNGREYYFEWHRYCGPTPLKQNGELSMAKRPPIGFYDMVTEFQKLNGKERGKYLA